MADWPLPGRLKTWVDGAGTVWRRVGATPLGGTAARSLVRDSTVRVVHFYGPEPRPLDDAAERAALWSGAESGLGGAQSVGFECFHYRDGEGRSLLAVAEYC